ncbi:hypothetical protein MLD38_007943 [Melastoma candidum]|uniref:Uncharacterized protein n=1 Tax=Melastoma candidum TaxID=119954 RepID=A0ACB9RSP8_9MYRT|nr:hypothetical protein MLD38_007943 [Melastoma candidum]
MFLGAQSFGIIRCKSFHSWLYNFSGMNKPDPSIDPGFLDTLRSQCGNVSSHLLTAPSASPSLSKAPSPCPSSFKSPQSPIEEPGVAMDRSPRNQKRIWQIILPQSSAGKGDSVHGPAVDVQG